MNHTESTSTAPKRIMIVMPAYNAERTLKATIDSLPEVYDDIIICDDASKDQTVAVARSLGLQVLAHSSNRGYGGNQKTLYREAMKKDPDVIVMVHPDNQYDVSHLAEGIALIERGEADFVLGNRMATARVDGMPLWRYASNRFLTLCQNITFGTHLPEFHSGLRLYRASLIKEMPFERFSNDFVFDSEAIAWAAAHRYRFGQMTTRCTYGFDESSINFKRSLRYGLETLRVLLRYSISYYNRLSR